MRRGKKAILLLMVIVREKNIGYWGIQVFYTEIIRLFFLQKIRLRLA